MGGRRRVRVVFVGGGRVVVVAVAVAVEGRRSVGGSSRWLGWEVVGGKCDFGYQAAVVVAASHAKNVSLAYT